MSDFIPKVPFEVYPGLEAMLWEDTPTWMIQESNALPMDIPTLDYFAARVALSIHSWRGENAPASERWPVPVRGEGASAATEARRAWCAENLPLRAMQRIVREVGRRSVLTVDEVGN